MQKSHPHDPEIRFASAMAEGKRHPNPPRFSGRREIVNDWLGASNLVAKRLSSLAKDLAGVG
jgi:hypothetical protein